MTILYFDNTRNVGEPKKLDGVCLISDLTARVWGLPRGSTYEKAADEDFRIDDITKHKTTCYSVVHMHGNTTIPLNVRANIYVFVFIRRLAPTSTHALHNGIITTSIPMLMSNQHV